MLFCVLQLYAFAPRSNLCLSLSGTFDSSNATSLYTEAQEIYARLGHEEGGAHVLYSLGELYCRQTKYDQATSSYTEAQEL